MGSLDPESLAPLGAEPAPPVLTDEWHSKPKFRRVICVGVGSAGLLIAYKMQKALKNFELVLYEKNPHISGTWYENRYPGCACDIPAHQYVYPFEPNPNWSSFYAFSAEIRQYFEDFATKYDLHKYVELNSKVVTAVWDEGKGLYDVEIDQNEVVIKDWCHVLINTTGFLNNWKWPAIPGLHDFQGKLLHSANWDDTTDFTDKRVALIGTGSSAIQILPQVQKTAKHVDAFMRSVTWISPPIGESALKRARKNLDGSTAETIPDAQYIFTEAEKKRFREDPAYHLEYRRNQEIEMNKTTSLYIKGSEVSKAVKKQMTAEMIRRIGPGHEELKKKLIPEWSPGCRRMTPGDGYLEALVKPNVIPIHSEVTGIVSEGLIDAEGVLHKNDVLICATGFNIAFAPPFTLKGRGGIDIAEFYDPEPIVYLAVATPGFPNYFIMNGVRGNWGSGVVLNSHEVQVDYIVECIKRMQQEDLKSLEVKMEPTVQLNDHIDKYHEGSIYSDKCKSWYKNNIADGKVWVWGGSGLHFLKTMKTVRWEHYDFKYNAKNMWDFLGNGFIEAQINVDPEKLAPYVRNSDTPWNMD